MTDKSSVWLTTACLTLLVLPKGSDTSMLTWRSLYFGIEKPAIVQNGTSISDKTKKIQQISKSSMDTALSPDYEQVQKKQTQWFMVWGSIVLAVAVLYYKSSAGTPDNTDVPDLSHLDYDPCCSWPCENHGWCVTLPGNNYTCDCTGTGFVGKNCHIASTWEAWFMKNIKPNADTINNFFANHSWMWAIINNIKPIHDIILKNVYLARGNAVDTPVRYNGGYDYITLESYYNETYYARSLPPVPKHCPTVMGDKGPKDYPDMSILEKKIFIRREFKPDPHNSNVLFTYWGQHFSHQFFRTDQKKPTAAFNKATAGVDASNIYGLTESDRQHLRSGIDGKLKSQFINGEEFPPYLKDVPGYTMEYPESIKLPEESKFALGHPFFALLPGLFAYATIWLREHNRICDILKGEHPDWDDNRLYETTRIINVGQQIKITWEDYIMQLSQYKFQFTFDPPVIHGTEFQFDNRIRAEFNTLYRWHPLIPDTIKVNENTSYSIVDMLYNNKPVLEHGIDKFVEALVNNRAGAITARNHPAPLINVLRKTLEHGRTMRFQSINNYRRKFGVPPFTSFLDMTGDELLAKDLQELYHDIEAVEFYVGLIAEKPSPSVIPTSIVNIGGPYSTSGLISNPICSPLWWKPSTFGGQVGFDIVQTSSIKKLFCNNMANKCQGIDLTFRVPNALRNN